MKLPPRLGYQLAQLAVQVSGGLRQRRCWLAPAFTPEVSENIDSKPRRSTVLNHVMLLGASGQPDDQLMINFPTGDQLPMSSCFLVRRSGVCSPTWRLKHGRSGTSKDFS